MIYMTSTITPEGEDEDEIVSLSLMRMVENKNESGEYRYNYGGWFKNREKERKYVSGFIYNKRDNSIFDLISKICKNADETIDKN